MKASNILFLKNFTTLHSIMICASLRYLHAKLTYIRYKYVCLSMIGTILVNSVSIPNMSMIKRKKHFLKTDNYFLCHGIL